MNSILNIEFYIFFFLFLPIHATLHINTVLWWVEMVTVFAQLVSAGYSFMITLWVMLTWHRFSISAEMVTASSLCLV